MQPEPTEVNKAIYTVEDLSEYHEDVQHGLQEQHHQHQRQDATPSIVVDSAGEQASNDDAEEGNRGRDESSGPSWQEIDDQELEEERLRGLSPSQTPQRTVTPGSRVTRYERQFSPSRPLPEGPTFIVVSPKVKRGIASTSILVFPNEVLTHILSHLPPASLSTVALVNRRFHSLVTTPHAWRSAFSRVFPGPDASRLASGGSIGTTRVPRALKETREETRSELRHFTRLTAFASWRSEYILRTHLLRSLARGRPHRAPITTASPDVTYVQIPIVTYDTRVLGPVTHLDGIFSSSRGGKFPRFIHAAEWNGLVRTSTPEYPATVDRWSDRDIWHFGQMEDWGRPWGEGADAFDGVPNVQDVSATYGQLYGEGFPGGACFFRSLEEKNGMILRGDDADWTMSPNIPKIPSAIQGFCALWIAKTPNVPSTTGDLIGMLSGSSCGVVTAYSLGQNGSRACRGHGRGQVTCQWIVSPGVPIVAIRVDESYNILRQFENRVWVVVLNALGEVFYLNAVPKFSPDNVWRKMTLQEQVELAWEVAATVQWSLVGSTRRVARGDAFDQEQFDPRGFILPSPKDKDLSTEELSVKTKKVEQLLKMTPEANRELYNGWDMRRKLEVDFAGDDGNDGGEAVFVFCCGQSEWVEAGVRRYTRCKSTSIPTHDKIVEAEFPSAIQSSKLNESLFGGPVSERDDILIPPPPQHDTPRRGSSSENDEETSQTWRVSEYCLPDLKPLKITTTAVDQSMYAVLRTTEDPLLSMSAASTASSPVATPSLQTPPTSSPSDIPGQRARFMAAGTSSGQIFVWNMRSPLSSEPGLVDVIQPVRIIIPQARVNTPITSLALTALYLVHGSKDGLVQAWDILASETIAIRTINSSVAARNLASNSRRRLQNAGLALPAGMGFVPARAICLDPDPTVLRGMVAIGSHVRYWSYNSATADQYTGRKRKLRRGERRRSSAASGATQRYSPSGRNATEEYIEIEKAEVEREKKELKAHLARMEGRFGVGMTETDEQALLLATQLSVEAFEKEVRKKKGKSRAVTTSGDDMLASSSSSTVGMSEEEREDAELARVIELSKQEAVAANAGQFGVAGGSSSSFYPETPRRALSSSPHDRGIAHSAIDDRRMSTSTTSMEESDFEYARQLSLTEERRSLGLNLGGEDAEDGDAEPVEFRIVTPKGKGKSKGKRRTS